MRKPYFFAVGVLTLVCALGLGSRVVSQPKVPAPAPLPTDDKAAIEALEQQYIKAFNAKDVNAIMASYAPGDQLFVFDRGATTGIPELGSVQEGLGRAVRGVPRPRQGQHV